MFGSKRTTLPTAAEALPGRQRLMPVAAQHRVLGRELRGPFPSGLEQTQFAMGCFWGAERKFWTQPGVYTTAVGYSGGLTPNPTYEEVCSGNTGHAESVLVVWDPEKLDFARLLKVFWEGHDPTQGMRQGNDVGTQYRSAIFCSTPEQLALARASQLDYGRALQRAGWGPIRTEIGPWVEFYYAEDAHQQYLAKNPHGYCGLGRTGVSCTIAP